MGKLLNDEALQQLKRRLLIRPFNQQLAPITMDHVSPHHGEHALGIGLPQLGLIKQRDLRVKRTGLLLQQARRTSVNTVRQLTTE
ncbi:hypothetical protein D3C77_410370 [compost metagenome]